MYIFRSQNTTKNVKPKSVTHFKWIKYLLSPKHMHRFLLPQISSKPKPSLEKWNHSNTEAYSIGKAFCAPKQSQPFSRKKERPVTYFDQMSHKCKHLTWDKFVLKHLSQCLGTFRHVSIHTQAQWYIVGCPSDAHYEIGRAFVKHA